MARALHLNAGSPRPSRNRARAGHPAVSILLSADPCMSVRGRNVNIFHSDRKQRGQQLGECDGCGPRVRYCLNHPFVANKHPEGLGTDMVSSTSSPIRVASHSEQLPCTRQASACPSGVACLHAHLISLSTLKGIPRAGRLLLRCSCMAAPLRFFLCDAQQVRHRNSLGGPPHVAAQLPA
jgi:hypothetical protein